MKGRTFATLIVGERCVVMASSLRDRYLSLYPLWYQMDL